MQFAHQNLMSPMIVFGNLAIILIFMVLDANPFDGLTSILMLNGALIALQAYSNTVYTVAENRFFTPKTSRIIFIIVTAFTLISLVQIIYNSATPLRSVQMLIYLLGLIFMFWATIRLPLRRETIRQGLWVLFISGVAFAIWGSVGLLINPDGPPRLGEKAFASLAYKNHWGYLAVISLSAGCALFHHTYPREKASGHFPEKSASIILLMLACLISIPLARARGAAILATALILVFAFAAIPRGRPGAPGRRRFLAAIAAGAVLFFAGFFASPQFANLIQKTENQWRAVERGDLQQTLRIPLYRDTWNLAWEKPLLGWGLGSFSQVHPQNSGPEFEAPNGSQRSFAYTHCDYLQLFFETGAIGLALLVFTFIAILSTTAGKVRWNNPISPWLAGGAALVAVAASFDKVLASPAVTTAAILALGMGIRYGMANESDHRR